LTKKETGFSSEAQKKKKKVRGNWEGGNFKGLGSGKSMTQRDSFVILM